MAVDTSLITFAGANIEINPPPRGVSADQFSLPILIKPLGTGKHIYKSRTLLYTIDTGGASVGDTFVQVAETIDPRTPSSAVITITGSNWTYDSIDAVNRRFQLNSTEHPTGLTTAYAAATEVTLTNDTAVTIDASEAVFDYQGATADQITIEADPEFDLTLVIPASESSNWSNTPGQKPILINSGAGQLWSPAVDLPYECIAWVAGAASYESDVANDLYYWYDITSQYRILCDVSYGGTPPDMVDSATKYVLTNGEGWVLEEQISPGVWTARDFNDSGDTVNLFLAALRFLNGGAILGGGNEYRLGTNGDKIRLFPNSGSTNWDGYSENGLLQFQTSGTQSNYEDQVSAGREPEGNMISVLSNNMNITVNRLFGRDNTGTQSLSSEVTAFLYVPAQQTITDAERQLMIRWIWSQAKLNGYTRDPDPTLVNGNQAPTSGTLGTINVNTPVPTVTITVIEEGSNTPLQNVAVHIDGPGGTPNVIDGVTDSNGQISVSYTGSLPLVINGWARSGSGAIAYQEAGIAGTINGDFNQTVILRRA